MDADPVGLLVQEEAASPAEVVEDQALVAVVAPEVVGHVFVQMEVSANS